MSMEAYRSLLLQTSQLRSISIDASGHFTLRPIPHSDGHTLEIDVAEALLGSSDCRLFEAITPQIPVLLPTYVASPLIDPTRWGEFSDIETSNAIKHRTGCLGTWSGTIEEKLRWKMLGAVIEYRNRLKISFDIVATGASVDFSLDESFSGGLEFEEGYFRLDEISAVGVTGLVSKKALRYAPPSDWCRLPMAVLEKILLVWLTAASAEYALRMITAYGGAPLGSAVKLAWELLQDARNLFDTTISRPLA